MGSGTVSGKRKRETKQKKKKLTYLRDEEEDEGLMDYTVYDVQEDGFIPANFSDDKFLNVLSEENVNRTYFEGEEEEEGGEDDDDLHGEEDDTNGANSEVEFRVHDPAQKWSKMKPSVGELYESPAQLRFALTNYAVKNGYQLRFCKSDKTRLIVKYGSPKDKKFCPFRLYAAWKPNERTFQIKTMVETHMYARNYKFGYLVTCNWLAKHYIKVILRNPKMTLPKMKEDVLRKFSVDVSISQCHRARVHATELLEGKLEDHSARVWDYANEVLKSNPGSTVNVGVTVNPNGNIFDRFYVCFKALRDGWKVGCRQVIGLDGCFLKGQVKGELLTAIGRDGNNHVYPIAWAVVNVENKDNWTWFLKLLVDDLGVDGGKDMVVISDQHKGLIQAVKDIMPNVEHMQCARHVYANFRKTYTGLELKNLFWAAATSSVEGDFVWNMNEIKKITKGGYDWLMARNPPSWCRAYFKEGYACEAVENGVSECFSAMILEIRKRPLLTMLEDIRLYMMSRFYFLSDSATKWKTDFCPTSIEKMNEFGKDSRPF